MPGELSAVSGLLAQADLSQWVANTVAFLKVVIGFSLIILVHELGHFWVAKWCGVRVDKFAIGFGPRLFGWRKGQGFTTGTDTHITQEEVHSRGWGESDYCLNALPFGGYVKMLGEDDILINEETGEMKVSDDPRAFPNRPVGQRMLIVSAGVVFNVIFAAFLYMLVFMIGHQQPAPIVGALEPASPAAKAGIEAGDVIVELDGWPVKTWNDVFLASVLNDEFTVRVERNGQLLPEPITIYSEWDDSLKLRQAGIPPARDLICGRDLPDTEAGPGLRRGDVILAANGKPMAAVGLIDAYVEDFSGKPLELDVRRIDEQGMETTTKAFYKPNVVMLPLVSPDGTASITLDRWSYFGLQPRLTINYMEPGFPAAEAGLEVGDILVQWGTVANPIYSDIIRINTEHGESRKPFQVKVVRQGNPDLLSFELTPTMPSAMGDEPGKVGVGFFPESAQAVVANIDEDSSGGHLKIPRGAQITAVAEEQVESWLEVLNQFYLHAGQDVQIAYRLGELEGSVEFRVPSSIYHALGISREARIHSIGGKKSLETKDGAVMRLPSLSPLQAILIENIGKTVKIEYELLSELGTIYTAELLVTEDVVDPWPARARLGMDLNQSSNVTMVLVRAGNPIEAVWMGVSEAGSKVLLVYQTLRRLLEAEVSVKHVSGPVGVISEGVKIARSSYTDLLLFLATLSINLAVINFLPFPVVDGGVMVFLIIEKIKGSPISLRVQMATTIVGLSIILLGFLLVTFKDIWTIFIR